MNVSENIIKYNLKNVYFLVGTALGGKTTMAKELSRKYGFIPFHDNHNEEHFKVWRSICDQKHQKVSTKNKEITDWETIFSRSVEEVLAAQKEDGTEGDEYLEFVLIELIKLSQNKKVIADVCFPMHLLKEISEYNRIACMLAVPELVTSLNYGSRDDHKDWLDCIMSLKEPDKKIAIQDELFKLKHLKFMTM